MMMMLKGITVRSLFAGKQLSSLMRAIQIKTIYFLCGD